MIRKSTGKNPKVKATGTIWGCAAGLFGICIPLVAATESGIILPLFVLIATLGGTAFVWLAPDKRQLREVHLEQTIKALEERVINLEAIYVSLPETEAPIPLASTEDLAP